MPLRPGSGGVLSRPCPLRGHCLLSRSPASWRTLPESLLQDVTAISVQYERILDTVMLSKILISDHVCTITYVKMLQK